MCAIVRPLPGPAVFERGVTEIILCGRARASRREKRVRARGRAGRTGAAGRACNVFTPIKGGFSQTQLGNTLSRVDKAPLQPGQYTLRITVDGQTAEVPFEHWAIGATITLALCFSISTTRSSTTAASCTKAGARRAPASRRVASRRSMRRSLSMPSGRPRNGSGTIPIAIARDAFSSRLRAAKS